MQSMKPFSSFCDSDKQADKAAGLDSSEDRIVLRSIGWVSAGLTMLALGVVIGRELRLRHKFNRRTPYDLYAHAGDEVPDMEFGVGI